eukprot:c20541_g1_i1.p1 GENE.c20541_g1_i1~~c20541_g1_i1.p1  ORF type:complete len:102 (+),score=3.92 c20541_g1_i1:129-434(+)
MTTRIYKIVSPSHPEAGVYIGATIQNITLNSILGDYRKHYRHVAEGRRKSTNVFDIAQYEDAIVEVLEKTNDKSRRVEIIKSTPNCLNKVARTKVPQYKQQ